MAKDFLTQIIRDKQEQIKNEMFKQPLRELQKQARDREDFRSFFDQLNSTDSVNIIAEIKRASPSKGVIQKDLHPEKQAKDYEQGGAKAISVLTEEKYFLGKVEDLKAARSATSLPVLQKDFFISEYQIFQALHNRADAILLIVRALDNSQLKDFFQIATELNLDSLVEIHDMKDLERLHQIEAKLIGINNRNLKSFDTSIENAIEIKNHLSSNQIVIAASGIFNRVDIEKNLDAGIHHFLIGESIVRSGDSIGFLKKLRGV